MLSQCALNCLIQGQKVHVFSSLDILLHAVCIRPGGPAKIGWSMEDASTPGGPGGMLPWEIFKFSCFKMHICRYFPVRRCHLIIVYTFDFKNFTLFCFF